MNSEENKALLQKFVEEFDRNWGLWTTSTSGSPMMSSCTSMA